MSLLEIGESRINEIFKSFESEPFTRNRYPSEYPSSHTYDLKTLYNKMVSDIRQDPSNIIKFNELFKKIFVEDEGLCIENKNVSFAYKGKSVTDFGVAVLGVKHLHGIDQMQHELELVVWNQDDPPKTVVVNSLVLGSSRWVEQLGVQYIYDAKNAMAVIKKSIKLMSKYAPVVDEYSYSGWALDKKNTYILEGVELCAKNQMS